MSISRKVRLNLSMLIPYILIISIRFSTAFCEKLRGMSKALGDVFVSSIVLMTSKIIFFIEGK